MYLENFRIFLFKADLIINMLPEIEEKAIKIAKQNNIALKDSLNLKNSQTKKRY